MPALNEWEPVTYDAATVAAVVRIVARCIRGPDATVVVLDELRVAGYQRLGIVVRDPDCQRIVDVASARLTAPRFLMAPETRFEQQPLVIGADHWTRLSENGKKYDWWSTLPAMSSSWSWRRALLVVVVDAELVLLCHLPRQAHRLFPEVASAADRRAEFLIRCRVVRQRAVLSSVAGSGQGQSSCSG